MLAMRIMMIKIKKYDPNYSLSCSPHPLHVHTVHQKLVRRLCQLSYRPLTQRQVTEALPPVSDHIVLAILFHQ